jgi:hypothetical protein
VGEGAGEAGGEGAGEGGKGGEDGEEGDEACGKSGKSGKGVDCVAGMGDAVRVVGVVEWDMPNSKAN